MLVPESQLLAIITFLPLATALGLLALARLPASFWQQLALGSTMLNFLLSLLLFLDFDPTRTGFQFVQHAPWLPEFGVNHFFGIDGVSLMLVLLTNFLMPIILLASWNEIKKSLRTYIFFMLFLQTGMLGAFVSLNLFEFYVFWELMLVPMYFIIGVWGGPRRIYASVKFFLFTMFGSLLMLVAILVVYYLGYEQTGALNFDLVGVPGTDGWGLLDVAIPASRLLPGGETVAWWRTQGWLFGAFALAFAVKVPMVPLHTWLPDAHVEAPTAGSVVLAGVLLKMGTYGFVRFALPLFPDAALELAPWFMGLALVGILYGSLVAMVQTDIKRLVAYSSVAHLGFVMLGIFTFNVHGLEGSVLQMVNHGLSTGALFLLVGMIYDRRHTREIRDLGGIARTMPVYAALFGVVLMSSIGLPGLNGFVGELLILVGTFGAWPWFAALAALGVVLAAAYMLWMYRRVMFGPVEHAENRGLIDVTLREKVVLVAVLIPIVWIGVYPGTFLRRIEPTALDLLQQMELRRVEVVAGEAQPAPAPPGESGAGAAAEPAPVSAGKEAAAAPPPAPQAPEAGSAAEPGPSPREGPGEATP